MSYRPNGYVSRMKNTPAPPVTYKKTQIENVEVSTIIYTGGTGNRIVETTIFLDPGPTHGLTEFDSVRSIAGNEAEQHREWVSKVSDAVYAPKAETA